MYVYTLFPVETFLRLHQAAPQVTETPPAEARLTLAAMMKLSDEAHQRVGFDDKPYFQSTLQEIVDGLPVGITSKRAGLLCRAMGVVMMRRSTGYVCSWNIAQLGILLEALK